MLDRSELKVLATWCHTNRLSWMPSGSEDGGNTVVLQAQDSRHAWERMLLVAGDEGFSLATEDGQTLAAASDLPALLDALDGGIAEPERAPVGPYFGVGAGFATMLRVPSLRYVV